MTATAMTAKQRAAIEAFEAARRQGCSLAQYARVHGLNAQRIHAMLSALRKQGLLARSRYQPCASGFVRVSVQGRSAAVAERLIAPEVVCRVMPGDGCIVECLQWPPAHWLASVSGGSADAAA